NTRISFGAMTSVDPQPPPRHVGAPLSSELKNTSMRRTVPIVLTGAACGALFLGGCSNIVNQRGFAPTPGSVEKLEIGAQSRDDVVRLIGSPSTVSTFNPSVWYYISQKQENFAFLKPEITQQNVMQLTFNDTGRLQAIKKYDLND